MFLLILFHAQHHPVRVMFRVLLLSLFGLHSLFHFELVRYVVSLLNRRAFVDCVQPALQSREWLCLCKNKSASLSTQTLKHKRWERESHLNTSPLRPIHPRKATNIRNTILPRNYPKPLPLLLLARQPIIQNLIQPLRLRLIALHSVINILRRVAIEVVGCAHKSTSTSQDIGTEGATIPCPCIGPKPLCIQTNHSKHSQYSSES